MNDAVLAAALLHLLGVGFLAAATSSWCRRDRTAPARRTGVVVNTLIGALAVGDAAAAVVEEPARIAHWAVGALIVLLVVGAVLVGHHARWRRERRAIPAPAAVVPGPRAASEAYMPLTSART